MPHCCANLSGYTPPKKYACQYGSISTRWDFKGPVQHEARTGRVAYTREYTVRRDSTAKKYTLPCCSGCTSRPLSITLCQKLDRSNPSSIVNHDMLDPAEIFQMKLTNITVDEDPAAPLGSTLLGMELTHTRGG